MSRTVTLKSIFAVVVMGAGLLAAGPVFALGVGGYEGKPTVGTNVNCVAFVNGGVQNQCLAQIRYILPLRSSAGARSVSLSTNNPGGGTFQCTLFAMNQTGTLTTGSIVFPNVGNQVNILTVAVPANGSMYLDCNVNSNGIIWNANYNE